MNTQAKDKEMYEFGVVYQPNGQVLGPWSFEYSTQIARRNPRFKVVRRVVRRTGWAVEL